MQTTNKQTNVVKAPTTVAQVQAVAQSASITVAQGTLRAARLVAVKQALLVKRIAAKHATYVAAVQSANMVQYNLAVQQLAAQYGVPAAQAGVAQRTLLGAATNIHTQQAPSAHTGSTARARAIAVASGFNRKVALAQCASEGINPATAATQYSIAKKAAMQ